MNWLSRPTASDWASARAAWNLVVSLSIRIVLPLESPFQDVHYVGMVAGNSTVRRRLQPNERGLPPGSAVAPIRVVPSIIRVSTLPAAVDTFHPETQQPTTSQCVQVRRIPAAPIRHQNRLIAHAVAGPSAA